MVEISISDIQQGISNFQVNGSAVAAPAGRGGSGGAALNVRSYSGPRTLAFLSPVNCLLSPNLWPPASSSHPWAAEGIRGALGKIQDSRADPNGGKEYSIFK